MKPPSLPGSGSFHACFAVALALSCTLAENHARAEAGASSLDLEAGGVTQTFVAADIIAAIEKSPERYPIEWSFVVRVEDGSTASRIGIPLGARLVERAGRPMRHATINRAAGDIVWLDPQGNLKRHHVPEGPLGSESTEERDFTAWYVRHGNRNPKWDSDVIAALVHHGSCPETSRQFWKSAHRKGYPVDALSSLCQMIIACNLGDPKDAEVHAKSFGLLGQAPAGLPLYILDWEQVSAITGDPKWLKDAAAHFIRQNPEDQSMQTSLDLAERWLEVAKESETVPSAPPSELAGRMQRKFIDTNANIDCPWAKMSENFARSVLKYSAVHTAASQDVQSQLGLKVARPREFYLQTWFGPSVKARDVDLTMDFTLRLFDPERDGKYLPMFLVGLANRTAIDGVVGGQVAPSARICSVSFSLSAGSQLGHSSVFAYVPSRQLWAPLTLRDNFYQIGTTSLYPNIPDHRKKPEDLHQLRIVRVGPQVEALLNGKRLALAPASQKLDDTGVFLFVSGVEVKIRSFQAHSLH